MSNVVRNTISATQLTKLPLFTADEYGDLQFDFNKIIPMPQELDIDSGSMVFDCALAYLTDGMLNNNPYSQSERKDQIILKAMKVANDVWALTDEEPQLEQGRKMYLSVYKSIWEMEYDANGQFVPTPVPERSYARGCSGQVLSKMKADGKTYVENFERFGVPTWYEWCLREWGTKWNAGETDIIDGDTIAFETANSFPEPVVKKLSEMYPDIQFKFQYASEDKGYCVGCGTASDGVVSYDPLTEGSQDAYKLYVDLWGMSPCLGVDKDGNIFHKDCDTCHGCD